MNWYRHNKQVLALRKNVMRADLHVHCGEFTDFNNPSDLTSAIKSVLIAAIVKGLDILGIVSHIGQEVGIQARQIAKDNTYDLFVISGQEYVCTDSLSIIAYNIPKPLPPNLSSEQAIIHVHQQGGVVMAIDVSKRHAQHFNTLYGTDKSPDFVEIYNASVGGYRDIEINCPKFISSAAKSAKDMETIPVYTIVERKNAEKWRIIPEGEGEDYEPAYLSNDGKINGLNANNDTINPAAPQNGLTPSRKK